MLFSIITVCFNAEKKIGATIESLQQQNYTDYEYLIIDGASTDGTVALVGKMLEKMPHSKIISEPDKGIYDAMNKAVRLSQGEYIYFLNAGDIFMDTQVLDKVARYINGEKQDLYYGNMILRDAVEQYPDKLSDFYFLREKMVCHQAIFSKRNLLSDRGFDTTFSLCADRDWLMYCFRKKFSYRHINLPIGIYDTDGQSSNLKDYQADSIKVIKKYYGNPGKWFVLIKRELGKIMRGGGYH